MAPTPNPQYTPLIMKLGSKDTNGKKRKRLLDSFHFHNEIQEATRVKETSETPIDLILISNQIMQKSKFNRIGIFEPTFPNHKPIHTVLTSQPYCKESKGSRDFSLQGNGGCHFNPLVKNYRTVYFLLGVGPLFPEGT